jgi:hypothetical protein
MVMVVRREGLGIMEYLNEINIFYLFYIFNLVSIINKLINNIKII